MNKAELNEKINDIVKVLKEDYRHRMYIQMTPWIQTHKVKMEDLYTRLIIEKHTSKPKGKHREQLVEYQKLFEDDKDNFSSKRILVKGNPGIGKTTFARKVAWDWAKKVTKLFSLTFLITLKYVGPNEELEDMIIKQSPSLQDGSIVNRNDIRSILHQYGSRCLIILDGYDEIADLDLKNVEDIVQNKSYRNCNIIVTSRPNAVKDIDVYTQASIEGFTKEKAKEYISKVIADKSKQNAVYEYMQNNEIEDMWKYPILVLFVCLLVNWDEIDLSTEKLSLGELYTRLLRCLFRRYLEERKKKRGVPNEDEDYQAEREDVFNKLGRLALRGLLKNKVAYRKKNVLKEIGENAFEYGILIGSQEYEDDRFLDEDSDIFVFFPHKTIQEFLAAKYFISQISSKENSCKDLLGNKTTGFMKNNMMFLTFCYYFVQSYEHLEYPGIDLQDNEVGEKEFSVDYAREDLISFMVTCIDKPDLKFDRFSMTKTFSALLVAALPECSEMSKLHLANIKLNDALIYFIEKVPATSVKFENCVIASSCVQQDRRFTFENIKEGIFVSKAKKHRTLEILLSGEWSKLEIIDPHCIDGLNKDDIETIAEANHNNFLPQLKQINMSKNIHLSGMCGILLNHPWTKLQRLDLFECELNTEDMTAIHNARMKGNLPSIDLTVECSLPGHIPVVPVMCGAWASQEELDLKRCDKQDLTTIAEANRYGLLPSVTKIDLHHGTNISNKIGALLGHSWKTLQALDIENCSLTTDDIKTIAKANCKNYLTQMKQLNMSKNSNLSGMCGILLNHPWTKLQRLHLFECDLNKEDMAAIYNARMKGILPSIDLTVRCSLSWDHIPVVPVMCGAWAPQEELDLRNCDKQDLTTIAEANRYGQMPSVKRIDVLYNKNISDQVGALLCGSWPVLEDLDLGRCGLTCRDVEALNQANQLQHLPRLKKLNLWECEKLLGAGLTALLSQTWPTLQELGLESCSLKEADCDTLLKACRQRRYPQLTKLNISANNGISGAGLSRLLSHTWSTLQELELCGCSLTSADGNTLLEACRQGRLPQLTKLNISGNDGISGAGLSSLLSHTWFCLQELDLQWCSLTAADGNTLLEACIQGRLPQLSKLDISCNWDIPSDMKDQLQQYITSRMTTNQNVH